MYLWLVLKAKLVIRKLRTACRCLHLLWQKWLRNWFQKALSSKIKPGLPPNGNRYNQRCWISSRKHRLIEAFWWTTCNTLVIKFIKRQNFRAYCLWSLYQCPWPPTQLPQNLSTRWADSKSGQLWGNLQPDFYTRPCSWRLCPSSSSRLINIYSIIWRLSVLKLEHLLPWRL